MAANPIKPTTPSNEPTAHTALPLVPELSEQAPNPATFDTNVTNIQPIALIDLTVTATDMQLLDMAANNLQTTVQSDESNESADHTMTILPKHLQLISLMIVLKHRIDQAFASLDLNQVGGHGQLDVNLLSISSPLLTDTTNTQLTIDAPLTIAPLAPTTTVFFVTIDNRQEHLYKDFSYTRNNTGIIEIEPNCYNLHTSLDIPYLSDTYVLNIYFVKSLEANKWDMYYVFNDLIRSYSLEFDTDGLLIKSLDNIEICLDDIKQHKIKIILEIFSLPIIHKKLITQNNGINNGKIESIFMDFDQQVHVMYHDFCLPLGKIIIHNGMLAFEKNDLSDLKYDELDRVLQSSALEHTVSERLILDIISALKKHPDYLNKKSIIDCAAISITPFAHNMAKFKQQHQMYYEKICMYNNMLPIEFTPLSPAQHIAIQNSINNFDIFMYLFYVLECHNEPCLVRAIEIYQQRLLQNMDEQYEMCIQNVNEPNPIILFSKGMQEVIAESPKQHEALSIEELSESHKSGAKFAL